jgi:hypothetical protein
MSQRRIWRCQNFAKHPFADTKPLLQWLGTVAKFHAGQVLGRFTALQHRGIRIRAGRT